MLRFELELEIFEGRLELADLPEAWNARMAEYLGVEVPDDASGVLQDVHWSGGAFGYFPTYSLGNVIAAQIWDAAIGALPELEARSATGELVPLRDWLRERLYRHGAQVHAEGDARAGGRRADRGRRRTCASCASEPSRSTGSSVTRYFKRFLAPSGHETVTNAAAEGLPGLDPGS